MLRGPKRKKLGHLVFSTSKLRSTSKLGSGSNSHWAGNPCLGQQFTFGWQSAFGLLFAFGPAERVWPAKRVSPANTLFTSKGPSDQQNDFPPANALITSKTTSHQQTRSRNAPSHTYVGLCQHKFGMAFRTCCMHYVSSCMLA